MSSTTKSPDILDIQNEISQFILGAQVTLSVYELIGSEDIIAHPQVNVYVNRNDQQMHFWVIVDPEDWRNGAVTAEHLGRYFRDEYGIFL